MRLGLRLWGNCRSGNSCHAWRPSLSCVEGPRVTLASACLSLSSVLALLLAVATDFFALCFSYLMASPVWSHSKVSESFHFCTHLSSLNHCKERNYATQRISVGRTGFTGAQALHFHSTLHSEDTSTGFSFVPAKTQQCDPSTLHCTVFICLCVCLVALSSLRARGALFFISVYLASI